VELIAEKPDFRPAVFCEDVEDVVIAGLETANPAPQNPVIALQDARRVFVQGSRAPENAEVYLRVEGAGSKQISVTGNDLSEAKNAVQLDEGALRGAVAVHS
jgi:hypothetical protein